MGAEAVAALRALVLAGVQSSAEYLDLDCSSDAIRVRDNGYVPRICGQLSTPGQKAGSHSACGNNTRFCKSAGDLQAAASVLGRNVLVIWTKRIELKATCVLWLCPEPNKDGVVAGAVEYQLVLGAGKDDTDLDNGADAYTLQPSSPNGVEAWQSALEAVSNHLPGGAPQLEQLVREVGLDAGLMYITELQDTYQLITNTAGQVLLLDPGESPDKLPPTPTGRVLCDLRAHLSIMHAKPSTVITLQNQTVPAVPLTQHIKVQRQEFDNLNVPAHLSGRDVSLKIKLTLGYDEYDFPSTEDQFGIHVYVKNMLVDTFYKVYPAMFQIAMPGHQKRLLGVCMLEGVPDLPQKDFLSQAPFKRVKDQLNSWIAQYLNDQQSGADAEANLRSTVAGDDEPAAKRARLASQTSSRSSSLIGSQLQQEALPLLNAGFVQQPQPPSPAAAAAARRNASFNGMADQAKAGAVRNKGVGSVRTRTSSWQTITSDLLDHVYAHPKNRNIYNNPVDPQIYTPPILDYFDIIKLPMDLGTVKHQLEGNIYTHFTQVFEHIFLVFDNAKTYNGPENQVHLDAEFLESFLLKKLDAALENLQAVAEKDPPVEPPAAYQGLFKVEGTKQPPPPGYKGLWPPVAQITSTNRLPLAAIRPYSPEGAAAMIEHIQRRVESKFNTRRAIPASALVTVVGSVKPAPALRASPAPRHDSQTQATLAAVLQPAEAPTQGFTPGMQSALQDMFGNLNSQTKGLVRGAVLPPTTTTRVQQAVSAHQQPRPGAPVGPRAPSPFVGGAGADAPAAIQRPPAVNTSIQAVPGFIAAAAARAGAGSNAVFQNGGVRKAVNAVPGAVIAAPPGGLVTQTSYTSTGQGPSAATQAGDSAGQGGQQVRNSLEHVERVVSAVLVAVDPAAMPEYLKQQLQGVPGSVKTVINSVNTLFDKYKRSEAEKASFSQEIIRLRTQCKQLQEVNGSNAHSSQQEAALRVEIEELKARLADKDMALADAQSKLEEETSKWEQALKISDGENKQLRAQLARHMAFSTRPMLLKQSSGGTGTGLGKSWDGAGAAASGASEGRVVGGVATGGGATSAASVDVGGSQREGAGTPQLQPRTSHQSMNLLQQAQQSAMQHEQGSVKQEEAEPAPAATKTEPEDTDVGMAPQEADPTQMVE